MINIDNVTVVPAADLSLEWWETAEQIIKAQICVQRYHLMDRPLTLHCSEHTIICTDGQTGDFLCQIFMPTAYDNDFRIVREILADDINALPEERNCMLFYFSDGFRLTGGNIDLTMQIDLSDQDATIHFNLTDGSDITLDLNQVECLRVDCEDPATADKTWTFNMESGAQVVISYAV